ncbi:cytochrome-c peroxidase [Thalassotalea sp. PLHSN55]|uniref:cytochrome-c peroxidase n=1 Tax=Thalassotalea sp. PLHSN55 TaxID=3435888 RepID=UPI003F84F74A
MTEQSKNDDVSSLSKTQFVFKHVDGPIQPIPTDIVINKNWGVLGKALFHSTLLSKDNTVSCASCHMVDFGGDDGFSLSTGVNNAIGTRNSPTVLNAVFNIKQFWDGRSSSLAEQAVGPIHNPIEMASSWPEIIKKLSQDSYFNQAFSRLSNQGVTVDNILRAIVTYEESLITPNSAIDRYLLGDKSALTEQQQRGYQKFLNLGCSTCHQGRNIGGNIMQKLGRISDIPEQLKLDLGRYNITNNEQDKHIFKVPSLRNVAQTSPYFHNGSIDSLGEAVNIMAKVQLGITLKQQDTDDIVALLQSFSAAPMEIGTDEAN